MSRLFGIACLALCAVYPMGAAAQEKICVPEWYPYSVFYFPCNGPPFAKGLAMYIQQHPVAIMFITPDVTGARGNGVTSGYIVVVKKISEAEREAAKY